MAAAVDPSDPDVLKERQDRGKCCLYLERKRRFCNMANYKGSIYCFNHAPNSAAIIGKPSPAKKARTGRRRVPCPLDPNHCVWEDKLERHLRVCEAAKRASATAALPYVRPGINLKPPQAAAPSVAEPSNASTGALAPPPRGDAELLRQVKSAAQLGQLLDELVAAYGRVCTAPEHAAQCSTASSTPASATHTKTNGGGSGGWTPPSAPSSVTSSQRHVLQQEALVELMAHR